jgi:hypothetical protein
MLYRSCMNESPSESPELRETGFPGEEPTVEDQGWRKIVRKAIAWFQHDDESANAPKMGRQQAAVDGVIAAVLRVTLAIGILVGSVVFAVKSDRIYEFIPDWKYLPRDEIPDLLRGIASLIWVAAAGVTIMLAVSDDDRKWRQLNWSVFGLLASGTLIPSGPWYGPLSVVAGLLGAHLTIHLWLASRDRQRQWLSEQERMEREQLKEQEDPAPRPKLLERYRGLAGFEEEETAGNTGK